MSGVKATDDIYFTISMAEVLERQGYFEDALMIYKILSDTDPVDESLKQGIERIKAAASKGGKRLNSQQDRRKNVV